MAKRTFRRNIDVHDVKKEVRKILGEKSGINFDIAVALMSAAVVGPNIVKVAKFAQLSRELIRKPFSILRDNHVFIGPHLNVEWFGKDGPTAFIMDVLVARGMVQRTSLSSADV